MHWAIDATLSGMRLEDYLTPMQQYLMHVKPVVSCNSLFACTGKRISTNDHAF